MPQERLTQKQRRLMRELDELMALLKLDYRNALGVERELRTVSLEATRNQLIRSAVILKYTLADEYLSNAICAFYFGDTPFPKLWRTKRFRLFNYYILERLYLLQKLDLVRQIRSITKPVVSDLGALNDLRNALAHSFFPENRRRKPAWRDKDIFTKAGVEAFLDDMSTLLDALHAEAWPARGQRRTLASGGTRQKVSSESGEAV